MILDEISMDLCNNIQWLVLLSSERHNILQFLGVGNPEYVKIVFQRSIISCILVLETTPMKLCFCPAHLKENFYEYI